MNDQRSLTDQIKELIELANKNGLYDAADWVDSHYKTIQKFAKEIMPVVPKAEVKIKTSTKKPKNYTVVCQRWEESERGWGVRPDGASLHLNKEKLEQFIKEWLELEKELNPSGIVPDCYTRRSGESFIIDVDLKTYNRIKKSDKKHGIWIDDCELTELMVKKNV